MRERKRKRDIYSLVYRERERERERERKKEIKKVRQKETMNERERGRKLERERGGLTRERAMAESDGWREVVERERETAKYVWIDPDLR